MNIPPNYYGNYLRNNTTSNETVVNMKLKPTLPRITKVKWIIIFLIGVINVKKMSSIMGESIYTKK